MRYPMDSPSEADAGAASRCARHIMLPEIGEKVRERLLKARVLLLGAGGLGSPAALYLAAAGIGTLGLIDADVVDASNLQRQILHGTSTVGVLEGRERQSDASRTSIRTSTWIAYEERVEERGTSTACSMHGWDVIVDGLDNFPTRYLINDASMLLEHPGRARLDLPLRRPGHDVRAEGRARATAACTPSRRPPHLAPTCAGSRRARRPARHHRRHPGHRSREAHPRRRRSRSTAAC